MTVEVWPIWDERWRLEFDRRIKAAEGPGMPFPYPPPHFFGKPDDMSIGDLYPEHAPRRKMVEGDLYA